MTEALPEHLPPVPVNEAGRLEALRRYNILDTPPEVAFDRITALAARLFKVPIALVSLVDESRSWFKSAYGFDLKEVQRDAAICSLALLSSGVLVIPNTRQDARLACNPFVQSEPGLRFYAGAPLVTHDGFNLGTLCLLDTEPHDALTDEQQKILADLAAIVMDELELRVSVRHVAQIDTALLAVTQGISAATGDAFFYALVQQFTETLGVDYTYIGLLHEDQASIKTIAACAKGQIVANFGYQLRDTPCQGVIQNRKLCCYPHGVQAQFPQAPLLKPLGVESYMAIPFFDSTGQPLGILGVMDGKPLINIQLAESLLTIFALRVATELERQQTEAARQQTQHELERLVKQRTAELSNANELLYLEIEERQQTEAVLQKEQETLKVLLDNVQAGIVACDAEGILTLFNRAAREFHGLPEQPLPPDQWAEYYDLYMPDGKTRLSTVEIPLFRALQGETVDNVEMVIAPKHGTARTLLTSGQAIADAQGKKQGAVAVMHNITERKQAEAELLISDVALQQMPDAIFLTDLEGKIQRWLGNAEQIFGYTAAEAIGQPFNFIHQPHIKAEMTARIMRSIQTIGEFCGEILCLRKDGSAVPIETTAKPVYDKAGNPLFFIGINKDITERKQAESERAQLIREQGARLKAEAEQRQSAFLVEVSTVLASSLNYEHTLVSVSNLVVPFFADWCAVDLLQLDQSIERVAMAHRDPEKATLGWQLHQRYPQPLDAAVGMAKTIRTGQPEMMAEISDAFLVNVAQDAEHLRMLRELGLKSCIISPLIARGQVLGAMSFVTAESDRCYREADLVLAENIAHQAAIAIDNARLYREAQQARQTAEQFANRTSVLQQITAALSQALTPSQVADIVMKQGIAALGAKAGHIALLVEQGMSLKILKAIGYPEALVEQWSTFSINSPVPLAETARTGEPLFLETGDAFFAKYPLLAGSSATAGNQALACLPLAAEGRLIGAMGLSFAEPQAFHPEDRAFILTLTQQCAQAIARAHLYEAEQIARSAAEAANQVKDEFLAVLSHELRSPLNPILGWSKLLQNQKYDTATVTRGLQTIERNARLQTQLIEDLLDVSRILRGKLNLDITPVALKPTIEAALETVVLAADAKAIQIQTRFNSEAMYVSGDGGRLQQVIWNLVSNAVKFTPQGGQVRITLDQIDTQAQLQISDNGIGIKPEVLPHIFERFRQADSKTTRQFGGLGLGLAIARQLVELHGGTVSVDSSGEGQGATFTVRLPLLKTIQNQDLNPDEVTLSPLSSAVQKQATALRPLAGLQILVVDDEVDARELVVFVLEQAGALVTPVASAIEALQALADLTIDVLISDIGMPEMDGYMLMRQLKSQAKPEGQRLPFSKTVPKAIALTAYAGELNQQKALAAGFQSHLSKPVEPTALVTAIANLVK